MTCDTWKARTESWLDQNEEHGEPDFSRYPQELRSHAESCTDCGRRLAALRAVYEPERQPLTPPAGVTERVTKRVGERIRGGSRTRVLPFVPARRVSRAPRQRAGGSKVAAVAASVLLVFALAVSVWFNVNGVSGSGEGTVTVRLTLEAPDAESVSVVGDWNQWDPEAHRMRDTDEDGVWEIRLEVEEGQVYQYQFIVDEERWIPDPEAPEKVKDGFGGTNSVLDV
ncbi:MAG: hypothetical protein ACLFUX_01620 [Spirochaetaceae bacterium]